MVLRDQADLPRPWMPRCAIRSSLLEEILGEVRVVSSTGGLPELEFILLSPFVDPESLPLPP